MATNILSNVKKLREQTSRLSRAEQIQWFATELGVDEARLLRLIGYSPAVISRRKAGGVKFTDLAAAKPDRTVWVSELLFELADRSGYDLTRLSNRLKKAGMAPRASKVGGVRIVGKTDPKKPPRATAGILKKIRGGGPDVLDHLTKYLALTKP